MSQRAALQGVAEGLELALTNIRRLLEEPDPDEWVGQEESPLGRRRHCALARAGKLEGARKVGTTWYVRRKIIDAFVEGGSTGVDLVAEDVAAVLAFRAPERKRKGSAR